MSELIRKQSSGLVTQQSALHLDCEIEILQSLLIEAAGQANSQRAAARILDDLNTLFRADAKLQDRLYPKTELAEIAESFITELENDSGVNFEPVRVTVAELLEAASNDN